MSGEIVNLTAAVTPPASMNVVVRQAPGLVTVVNVGKAGRDGEGGGTSLTAAERAATGEIIQVVGYTTGGVWDAATQARIDALLVEGWPDWAIYVNYKGERVGDTSSISSDLAHGASSTISGSLVGLLFSDLAHGASSTISGSLIGILLSDDAVGQGYITDTGLSLSLSLAADPATGASSTLGSSLIGVLASDVAVGLSFSSGEMLSEQGSIIAAPAAGVSSSSGTGLVGVLLADVASTGSVTSGTALNGVLYADIASAASTSVGAGVVGVPSAASASGTSVSSGESLIGILSADSSAGTSSTVGEGLSLASSLAADAAQGAAAASGEGLVGLLSADAAQGAAATFGEGVSQVGGASSDQWVQGSVASLAPVNVNSTGTPSGGSGMWLRKQAGVNSGYFACISSWTDGDDITYYDFYVNKIINGVFSTTCASVTDINSPDLWKVTIVGSAITILRNGTQMATGTDSSYATGITANAGMINYAEGTL